LKPLKAKLKPPCVYFFLATGILNLIPLNFKRVLLSVKNIANFNSIMFMINPVDDFVFGVNQVSKALWSVEKKCLPVP
jgi:hypothetical protein